MSPWFLLRARAVWVLGAAMVAAGLALLSCFAALAAWRFDAPGSAVLGPALQLVPGWLTGLNVITVLGVLGVAVGTVGLLLARQQAARIALERMRAADRLRRVRQYREAGRVEPFIGPAADAGRQEAGRRWVA